MTNKRYACMTDNVKKKKNLPLIGQPLATILLLHLDL